MKKLIIISLISLFTLSAFSQYAPPKGWKSPELYLPSSILIGTFTINHNITTDKERKQIAITGMLISVATHFIFKKLRKRKPTKHKKY